MLMCLAYIHLFMMIFGLILLIVMVFVLNKLSQDSLQILLDKQEQEEIKTGRQVNIEMTNI